MKKIDSIILSGKEALPLVEGGKGIAVSSGESSGAWAKAGGVGTFSGVNADSYDENGKLIPQVYKEKQDLKGIENLLTFLFLEQLNKQRLLGILLEIKHQFT